VILGPKAEALGGLVNDERWSAEGPEPDPRIRVWTDDFHKVLSVLKWRCSQGRYLVSNNPLYSVSRDGPPPQ
jgi:hypothetical protein